MLTASLLDRLVGDPRQCLHPVVVMGWLIDRLRRLAETWSAGYPWRLRVSGGLITVLLVGGSGGAGWALERLAPWPLLVIALASALAGRSLSRAVRAVLEALPVAGWHGHGSQPPHPHQGEHSKGNDGRPQKGQEDLAVARERLAWIVGRDVELLDETEILRACAETASENAVDGVFAPLFWMLVGLLLWQLPGAPGPLCLAWGFKAASTLDSMLGYRRGTLRWLGTAGARLDDLLTWLPCRLVAFSLPLAGQRPWRAPELASRAMAQGRADPSPNSGVSQAIYALEVGVQLGGWSRHGGEMRYKPTVGVEIADGVEPRITPETVEAILNLTARLQGLWMAGFGAAGMVSSITKTLS